MPSTRLERGDWVALGLLCGIPLLFFAIPAAIGYPLLTGDAVIQNYPLGMLAGEVLRHGHLPIYNPLSWGGTPLLASANASVVSLDTVAFAFLPALSAWVLIEAATFAATAVGLYTLLRFGGLRPVSAAIGGATFAFCGYVSSQAVHLDVLQTAAALAWVLVALERIAHGQKEHQFGWTAFLGVAAAAAGLSGNPETVFYAAVGAGIYAISLLFSVPRPLVKLVLFVIGAGAGALVAAVEVIPAAKFVAISQRASVPYSFLVGGSLRPSRIALLVAPHLLGGGPIGLRPYIGSTLAEIDAYPGIFALVAVVALAFRFRSPSAQKIRVWYLIGLVGLLIALGPETPIPSVIHHLPIIDSSRLPSRALLLFSLAASVLVGYWSSEFLEPGTALPLRRRKAEIGGSTRAERIGSLVAPGAVVALVVACVIGGTAFARRIAGRSVAPWTLGRVAAYLVVALAIAVAVGWLVWHGWRLSPRARLVTLVSLFAIDLLVFTANQSSLAPIRTSALGRPNRYEEELARDIGPTGRFMVVDPRRQGRFVLDQLGAPNLNVFSGLESAQGYGSLTWGEYAKATGTHGQDLVSPPALASSVFDSLDVRALLVLPSSFESANASSPLSLSTSQVSTRYFGADVDLSSICIGVVGYVPLSALKRIAAGTRLIGAPRHSDGRLVESACGIEVDFHPFIRAVGLMLPAATGGIDRVVVSATTKSGRRFGLTGPLAPYVGAPHWQVAGSIGPYLVLRDADAVPQLFVTSKGSSRAVAARIQVTARSEWSPTETVVVTTSRPGAELVRDVADIPGWRATLVHGRRATTVVPERRGLVQAVSIEPGKTVVTFRYLAPGLAIGEALAGGGIGVLLGLVAAEWLVARRRHAVVPRLTDYSHGTTRRES